MSIPTRGKTAYIARKEKHLVEKARLYKKRYEDKNNFSVAIVKTARTSNLSSNFDPLVIYAEDQAA